MNSRIREGVLFVLAAAIVGGCTTEFPPPEAYPAPEAFNPQVPPPPMNFVPAVNPIAADFNGKYVAVNHMFGDELETTVLHSPTVKKLGSRDFLVGEVVGTDGRPGSVKSKTSQWVPVDTVDSMIVFETKDQAILETDEPVGPKM